MKKPGRELRLAMMRADIDYMDQTAYLAELLGKSIPYCRDRISGRKSWTIAEAVKIAQKINVPSTDIIRVFS